MTRTQYLAALVGGLLIIGCIAVALMGRGLLAFGLGAAVILILGPFIMRR